MNIRFPKDFLWGAATSAYQVEGGIESADWSRFFPAGKACDHYRLYEEDFDLLEELNLNAYRFSLEWSRLEPEPGGWDREEAAHYRAYLEDLKARGMKTMVTLHHFTTPLWMAEKGGWESREMPKRFARFAARAFSQYGDLVDFWLTINEPFSVYAPLSYLTGQWPPRKKNPLSFLKVVANQIRAHKKVYEALHPEGRVGVVKNNAFFKPVGKCPLNRALARTGRYFANRFFLDRIRGHLDFIGLNYYFPCRISCLGFSGEKGPLSDIGWEVWPEGIYHVLKDLGRYDLPVYITENGVADKKDRLRKDFVKKHLFWAHKAMEEGVDLRGYFYWSLLDNLEWDKGFGPRFGLAEVGYETMERELRDSARFYARVAKQGGFEAQNFGQNRET